MKLKWPNDLGGQGQRLIFNTSQENRKMHIWCKLVLALIHYKLSHRQAKFPKILRQNGQNDIEGHGKWTSFSIIQIWWSQLKSVVSYNADNIKFMDIDLHRRTDTGNDNTQVTTIPLRPFRPRGGNGACHSAAIAEITIEVPCWGIKSQQLICRLGTWIFHLWVPNIQMSCRDLT